MRFSRRIKLQRESPSEPHHANFAAAFNREMRDSPPAGDFGMNIQRREKSLD